jgi:PPOX class probable FMN-dependent enzyme
LNAHQPPASGATIATKEGLRAVYKAPNPRSVAKQLARLDPHCRRFVELSPFVVMGSTGATGHDVSPRGGPPGFVKVVDAETLVIPDFPGNNRLDSLENLLEDDRVGLLFLVPGVDETLRVNGRAAIDTDPALRAMSTVDGKLPIAVLRVAVEQAYLHCGKALMRSALWDPAVQIDRASLPSMGEMLKDQIRSEAPAETQAEMLVRYRDTLY